MDSELLFNTNNVEDTEYPEMSSTITGKLGEDLINVPTISDKIANFLKQTVRSENNSSVSSQGSTGTVQSSALVMSGPYPINTTGTSYVLSIPANGVAVFSGIPPDAWFISNTATSLEITPGEGIN
jgi:hypothetical protein